MLCTISDTEVEVGQAILAKALQKFITDRYKAVVLLWFSVAWFGCQYFVDVSSYVCSYYFTSA